MPANPVYQPDEADLSDFAQIQNEKRHSTKSTSSTRNGHYHQKEYRKNNVELRELHLNPESLSNPRARHSRVSIPLTDPRPIDPWDVPELHDDSPQWSSLTSKQKWKRVFFAVIKMFGVAFLLYFFVIALDLLSSAFRLIGGRAAGRTFQESELLSNPIVGLMIGVLVTVIVQSSSTSTSITIAMVSSGMLDVNRAIFIIMGANVGTTITNTLVSLAQSADRDQFRRAFAGATIHDMFNWLTVAVLLPLECFTGYLALLSGAILRNWGPNSDAGANVELLNTITKPVTHLFIQLNSRVIEDIARNQTSADNTSMIKETCATKSDPNHKCFFMFHKSGLGETVTGVILLGIALILLCVSLVGIVKILNSIMKGALAKCLKRALSADFPKPFSFLTGYVAMMIGAGVTFLIQSSSVFTSALTPLVGIGVVSIERMYPLTLGSNIGTTGTSLLAAMASDSRSLKPALQVALCHLFFNISGILIWYPIPIMREVPIALAKSLGNVTAQYRWFAGVYIILVFLIIPSVIVGLTLGGPALLLGVGIPLLFGLLVILLINFLQRKFSKALPGFLRDWEFLPNWMHSLEPYDRLIKTLTCYGTQCWKSGKSIERDG